MSDVDGRDGARVGERSDYPRDRMALLRLPFRRIWWHDPVSASRSGFCETEMGRKAVCRRPITVSMGEPDNEFEILRLDFAFS